MKVQMSDAGVPIVVTYRKVLRKPKLKRRRRYLGVIQTVKNLLVKAIEAVEEAAFDTETEVIDPGQSVSVHWAISVEDPWDTTTGAEKNLVAYRMLNDIPPSGVHFEVISASREVEPTEETEEEEELTQVAKQRLEPTELTPEQFRMQRSRLSQRDLLRETRSPDGKFRLPPAPEYGPRRVRTIDEEIAEGGADEDAENLDGPGGLGEDD